MNADRIDTVALKASINLIDLVGRYTTLHKVSSQEWAGPCPKCGGTDRFHVKADWFFCRQCNERGGDVFDFVQWMQPGLSFPDAAAQLAGGTLPTAAPRQPERARHVTRSQAPSWQRETAVMLQAAQERLLEDEGEPGREYLLGRGLEPRTWLQFGLGYRADVSLPGTEGKQKAPAICMPWYAGGRLIAVRYRFLQLHRYVVDDHEKEAKQTAAYGSQFRDKLFGGHALPEWVNPADSDGRFERMCDLIICEGEINAMSIWQVASNTNLHVLSLGSESARLPNAMVAVAQRYRNVIIWADRAEVARNLQAAIPEAHSITSPNGQDANDLLQSDLLGAVLGMARLRACRNDYESEGLLWDLWDASQSWLGVDTGTKQVIRKIADSLGRVAEVAA